MALSESRGPVPSTSSSQQGDKLTFLNETAKAVIDHEVVAAFSLVEVDRVGEDGVTVAQLVTTVYGDDPDLIMAGLRTYLDWYDDMKARRLEDARMGRSPVRSALDNVQPLVGQAPEGYCVECGHLRHDGTRCDTEVSDDSGRFFLCGCLHQPMDLVY